MTFWIIEPRDPLIVRDGRPFGPNPGARARTLPFPFPSTTTGGVRTRDGQRANGGIFMADAQEIARVLKIGVRGPLLAELDAKDGVKLMVPAPADALLLSAGDDSAEARRRRLVPLNIAAAEKGNLPAALAPVGMTPAEPEKPLPRPPTFWYWQQFEKWLCQPVEEVMTLAELGHRGPLADERMHVSIEAASGTAREGFLFLTSGLEFQRPRGRRLALALETDADLDEGFGPLGGERRLMRWRKRDDASWPELPAGLAEKIVETEHCRLFLLTPAYFDQGWLPSWLLQPRCGVKPELKAAVVPPPQVVSGWNYAAPNGGAPKPSRRLAPAGSVYFLRLGAVEGEQPDRPAWIQTMWMACVSDAAPGSADQHRLDGFGLAAIGIWDGGLAELTLNKEATDGTTTAGE